MNWIDYTIILIYLLGFLAVGYFFKNNKTPRDYFLGGRNIGWLPLSLSTMATQLSAISFISAPAFVGLKNGGGMRLTISKYYLPSGKSISEVGVSPDILVKENENEFEINSSNDNQLNYALQLLQS